MVKRVNSSENLIIKKASSLRLKKFRDKESLYLIEGLRICEDILWDKEKEAYVETIILTEDKENLIFQEPFSLYKEKIIIISDKLEKEITDTVTGQGVFVILKKEIFELEDKIDKYSRVLILDNISDPGNMGTIIRTALAARFDTVISLKGSVDIYNPKVIRSTMGAINKIDVYDSLDLKEVFSLLRKKEFKVFTADLKGDKTIYDSFSAEKIALVMGSEAKGVTVPAQYIDMRVTVPMNEKSESLNVSVAAGILMYKINKSKFEK